MTAMPNFKTINPDVMPVLKEALAHIYWYKDNLRSYLIAVLKDEKFVNSFDWNLSKRDVSSLLVDSLFKNQNRYFETLLDLLLVTADFNNLDHLLAVEDGIMKHEKATLALKALRRCVEPYRRYALEQEESASRKRERAEKEKAELEVKTLLSDLDAEYKALLLEMDAQKRGYAFESLLNKLFQLHGYDHKPSYRTKSEQIDGAFTFEGTEYLYEARWRKAKTTKADLVVFESKVENKLDNTLGVFISLNGFEQNAIEVLSSKKSVIFLVDGYDLTYVFENRIHLSELLTRKKQHAARTGQIMLSVNDILA